ncbi:MAG: hypothetical protein IKC03_02375 [Oscillospiraceae bacterium]|nr:hypothetical protein [Oscillospiraceae bacterium]
MKHWRRKLFAGLMTLILMCSLVGNQGTAALKGVYFSAVDDQLLEMSSDTMPFYSGGMLYISNKFFENTGLDVRYVRNQSMGLALLYTSKIDLRFDLVHQTVYDKQGTVYKGAAIEKSGYVFFPIDLVCKFFGLRWSLNHTETVPLIRLKSDRVVLDDRSFVAAASMQMNSRYQAYEKQMIPEEPLQPVLPPIEQTEPVLPQIPEISEPEDPIPAAEGQKVYLILSAQSPDATREILKKLGNTPVTFLLTEEQLSDADFVRAVIGNGHAVALLAQGETLELVEGEIRRARKLMWSASCSVLQLIWYEGAADISQVLEEQGCVSVTAMLDRRTTVTNTEKRVTAFIKDIGRYQEDVSVYLGTDTDSTGGLEILINRLSELGYQLSAWRLTA